MNTSVTTNWLFLAANPKSFYRQLFIKGTKIRARVIYGLFMNAEEPMTPEEIVADTNLSLEAVREAIAYCQSNPPEVEGDYCREQALNEAAGMNDPDYKIHGKRKLISAAELARIRAL